MSHLGKFFRQRRGELGLGHVAHLLGYTNHVGGANRIQRFERGGIILGRLAPNRRPRESIRRGAASGPTE
jgi:hypothetical protein